jgi:hypothetical protein
MSELQIQGNLTHTSFGPVDLNKKISGPWRPTWRTDMSRGTGGVPPPFC